MYHVGREGFSLALPFESSLPYLPYMAVPYLMGYTLVLLPALYFPEIKYFRRGAAALIVATVVSAIFFIFMPVRCVPPAPVGVLDQWMLNLHWLNDQGWNAFPSLHVAIASICCLSLTRIKPLLTWYAIMVWIAIFASTIFLKRHYLADSVAGCALGVLCHFLIVEPELRRHKLRWRFW
jgi:membrane-associated phospholipid phosphatase